MRGKALNTMMALDVVSRDDMEAEVLTVGHLQPSRQSTPQESAAPEDVL
jgi:hypothetical protein